MIRRYIRLYSITLVLFLLATVSCTNGFEELNVNPTAEDDPPTSALMTQSMILASTSEYEAWRANYIYSALFVQQLASTNWQGDKYFYNDGYSASYWDRNYERTVKVIVDLINRTKTEPAEVNYNSIGRILKVIVFHRMTDLYGDVPYRQAGMGYIGGILIPEYDTQEFIYNDMLSELEQAINAFDASKPISGDIMYGGDIALWKKGAYSLMLRLAMRLSKAAPATAETWAKKAVAGGVISAYTEAFKVSHTETTVWDNPNSHVLGSYPGAHQDQKNNNFRISKTFIDLLRNNNDPRLGIIPVQTYTVRAPGDTVNIDFVTTYNGTADPAAQVGLPNGRDGSASYPLPSGKTINRFSIVRSELIKPDAPNILVSHSQTLFLQAEAAARGWITGDAEALFRAGVKSAIDQYKLSAPAALFNDAAITNYAQNVVAFPTAGTLDQKLAAINTQYYIASFLDGYESFANWRRSGYPVLTPINFPGNVTGGTIPRRLRYPASESGLNGDNLKIVEARQGADLFTTRVWWDKP
ncbi:SusD/RagB family nutrient-binding outer membrane lipoprotein [Fulvivirgaceae bacterium PWU4]|uniref:SusD/RagB family nutrient-binding outer membrane lipoprotein n=1 Tax=Chryseosolibacter histidini TaxID=2782349 RepID=A0AAP2DGH4_9BACT|nr:SusD/RagB family nutrient-binding outer membrane lipoprotein [Chryseosolibacter histidini]MBT1695790.1 SusD/RagB family nutrient-binding outer membrane lipoprotein [Chryseosolibacter histidini]